MFSETLLGLFDGYMSSTDDKLVSETKFGGAPTYFPSPSPVQRQLIDRWTCCGVCGHPMFLVLQAYSPLAQAGQRSVPTPGDSSPWQSSHHRMLYVFCCNSSACARQPSSSWAAFSLQIDQDRAESTHHDNDDVIVMGPLLQSELPPNCFPPFFIRIVVEPDEEEANPTDLELEMIKMAEANAKAQEQNGGVGIPEQDLEELAKVVDLKDNKSDYYYEKFRKRIGRAPTQVLRYHQRTPLPPHQLAATGKASMDIQKRQVIHERPVFMNPLKLKHHQSSIPACTFCGGSLVYEVEIMPTSLYYLRAHEYVPNARNKGSDDGVDFGTATIYTCSNGCGLRQRGVHLRREVVIVEEAPQINDDNVFDEAPADQGAASRMSRPRIKLTNLAVSEDGMDKPLLDLG